MYKTLSLLYLPIPGDPSELLNLGMNSLKTLKKQGTPMNCSVKPFLSLVEKKVEPMLLNAVNEI